MNMTVMHHGSCHCKAVKWECDAEDEVTVIHCNCSVCHKKQNHHFMVPAEKFRLVSGETVITTYTFNTHAAKHKFCSICGVQSFYIPRSHPHCVAVMPHCIDSSTVKSQKILHFNGVDWEGSMKKSQEEMEKLGNVPVPATD